MQQALLVDHPSMENASYNQVAALHLKCHTLNIDARLLFKKKKPPAISQITRDLISSAVDL